MTETSGGTAAPPTIGQPPTGAATGADNDRQENSSLLHDTTGETSTTKLTSTIE